MKKRKLLLLSALALTMATQGAWAEGELTGKFSVSSIRQVVFSKSNLRATIASGPTNEYNYTASTWRFADFQWSYFGDCTFNENSKVELLGWVGTSASYDTYGICTNTATNNAYYGTSTGDKLKSDWGTLAITNGGNAANSGWYTLSSDEWNYLFKKRNASTVGNTENGRFALGVVNNSGGVIIFPDSYTHPDGVAAPTGVNNLDANYYNNKYDGDAWGKMEEAGAVFLPKGSNRTGKEFSQSDYNCYYWSSTPCEDDVNKAYGVQIGSYGLNAQAKIDRSTGCYVRLVKLAPLDTDEDGAYLIRNAFDWGMFCEHLYAGNNFSGKTVKLTDNISISSVAGSEIHPFSGTFDGQTYTLNVNLNLNAPFGGVKDGTIKDLVVTGAVNTLLGSGADHTAGLICKTEGTVNIENVRVSATVTGLTYYGGFIGHGGSSTINMTGCVFDGTLTEFSVNSATQYAGGFIGWGGNMAITMSDCLFAGTCDIGSSSSSAAHNFHPVGFYSTTNNTSVTPALTNVYYTAAPSTNDFPNNGAVLSISENQQVYSITAADANVTTFEINGNPVAAYDVSGLKRYTVGLACGTTLYAGGTESLNLTLGHAEIGGRTFTGYEVSGGGSLTAQNETSATLAMSAANQTISAVYADNPSYVVAFVDGTDTGWSTEPTGTARDGETVTVSYTGEHKVKSVTVKAKYLIESKFSVSATKQVYFSKGNLQAKIAAGGPKHTYNYSASSWKFADNQWDYIGNAAGNNSFAADSWVDLFGWVGASATYGAGSEDGNYYSYGLCTDYTNTNKFYGNVGNEALKSDWGTLWGDGWRTLTSDEWNYLLNTREASTVGGTEKGRYAKATVNGVKGVILFPDSYTHPGGVTTPANVNAATADYTGNSYADDAWTQMETAGAVFLPITGFRYMNSEGIHVDVTWVEKGGYYWSSSSPDAYYDKAYAVEFDNDELYPTTEKPNREFSRHLGIAVRLVMDAK